MIIKAAKTSKGIGEKGTLRRGGFKQLSAYLRGVANNAGENEECNFIASNTCLKDINDFCIMGAKLAAPKRSGKNPLKSPIEHIAINTRAGDILTPEMILQKLPELLKAMTDDKGRSYADCPWMLVQHQKRKKENGKVEPHYHLVIVRVDDKGRVPNPRTDKICFEKAQEFARFFGFKPAFNQAYADRLAQQADHLARLWEETKDLSPAARLKKFEKGGFIAARHDKRDEIVFLDRYGKPHSLHRVPGIKAAGMKQADITAAFGFDKNKIAALPTVSKTAASIRRKNRVRRFNRKIAKLAGRTGRIFARVCGRTLSEMRSGRDLDNKRASGLPLLIVAWGLSRSLWRNELQPIQPAGIEDKRPQPSPTLPKFKPKRKKAGRGWWVAARAENTFLALILAGFTAEQAQAAADSVWEEEEQRHRAEQRYLDELTGWTPERSNITPGPINDHHKK